MLPPIFIGGTMRCGTTILYEALGCHEKIHSFPTEMRFIVDPDGLIGLVDALTVRYSNVHAREALYRFERLMRVDLASPRTLPYPGFDFPDWLGGDYYFERLDQFCSELVQVEFDGTAWHVAPSDEGRLVAYARRLQALRRRLQRKPPPPIAPALPRKGLKAVRYFPDRSHLTALAAAFVDDLFSRAARENGKSTWCEKTPQNLLYVDFLWQLFPESAFIHIKRHPAGVAYSLTQMRFAPNTLKDACLFLQDTYRRWFDLRSGLDLTRFRYIEVKLEDLAASPRDTLGEIASGCGLTGRFENLPDISLDKVEYWRAAMPKQDLQLVHEILGPYVGRLGYTE